MTSTPFRAIVVDDDLSWQQILGEILTDAGLAVDSAGSLDEALPLMKSHPHRLALVDLSLTASDHHNQDGLKILEMIKRLDPGCQSILLTGFATVELAVSALTEYGAFSFLRKENFKRSQLKELVTQVLASAPMTEGVQGTRTTEGHTRASPLSENESSTAGKVLVVEDDAGWRSILTELLNDDGYAVRGCSGFGEALGVLRHEKIILAVVDLSLTGDGSWTRPVGEGEMEGAQLLMNIKAAGVPAIVVSGVTSINEIRSLYEEKSVYAFLQKQSFERNAFRRTVREALRASGSDLDRLTEREREVYDLLARGLSNKEIADTLVITNNTVKRHLKAIFEKLDVHTRAAAIAKSLKS